MRIDFVRSSGNVMMLQNDFHWNRTHDAAKGQYQKSLKNHTHSIYHIELISVISLQFSPLQNGFNNNKTDSKLIKFRFVSLQFASVSEKGRISIGLLVYVLDALVHMKMCFDSSIIYISTGIFNGTYRGNPHFWNNSGSSSSSNKKLTLNVN